MIAKLRWVAAAALVLCAFVNLAQFVEDVFTFPPRQTDDRVRWEQRLTGIRNALRKAHYDSGNIGYIPAGVLRGKERTDREDVDWVQVRYAMIPLNVLQDSFDAPFVIAESSNGVDGFETVFDGHNGLILLQKK
jgi:hypothetical protein